MGLLAMVTATLAKIGQEVYELQRPEIGELREPFTPGQVGSITMPHKRNPELSEHLVTLARVVRADASVCVEAMVHEHERDGRALEDRVGGASRRPACSPAPRSCSRAACSTGSRSTPSG